MIHKVPSNKLTKADLLGLRDRAKQTLDGLVTPGGIYASANDGWKGPFYGWFGRDSAITTDLICTALAYGGDKQLAYKAWQGLASLTAWQGAKDNETTGEERGKLPHEIRNTFNTVDKVQHASGTNQLPWYIDVKDGLLKNWDSADSTALWIVVTIRAHKALNLSFSRSTLRSMKRALEWIMRNIKTYNGLVGFTGADLQSNRQYSGLHNQGWKDSSSIYQNEDGTLALHPIKDVLVNAEAWAALCEASDIFASNKKFAQQLQSVANQLKIRFNDVETGFLLPEKTYYAQAIDGQNRQLPQRAADVGMILWANYNKVCIIEPSYINEVVHTITGLEMFNPQAGIRDYELGTVFKDGTLYHGSPYTYWPFVSALVASGLEQFGYHHEALEVINASLLAVNQLGSNIEMFIETPDKQLSAWHHPTVGQESASEQAWTAAAVYFGSLVLLYNKHYA